MAAPGPWPQKDDTEMDHNALLPVSAFSRSVLMLEVSFWCQAPSEKLAPVLVPHFARSQ